MATSPCAHRLHAVVFFSLLIVERILQLTGFASTSSRDGSRGSPSSSCVWCVALLSPFTCVVCVLVACEIINTELWCCFIFLWLFLRCLTVSWSEAIFWYFFHTVNDWGWWRYWRMLKAALQLWELNDGVAYMLQKGWINQSRPNCKARQQGSQ